jgi:hypothetical protein
MAQCLFCNFAAIEDHEDLLRHIDHCRKAQQAVILRFWPDSAIARDDTGCLHWLEHETDEDGMSCLVAAWPLHRQHALQEVLGRMHTLSSRISGLRRAAEFLAREIEPRLDAERPGGTIAIDVKGGLVQSVEGLPPNWNYELTDWDACPTCGLADSNCPDCKEK